MCFNFNCHSQVSYSFGDFESVYSLRVFILFLTLNLYPQMKCTLCDLCHNCDSGIIHAENCHLVSLFFFPWQFLWKKQTTQNADHTDFLSADNLSAAKSLIQARDLLLKISSSRYLAVFCHFCMNGHSTLQESKEKTAKRDITTKGHSSWEGTFDDDYSDRHLLILQLFCKHCLPKNFQVLHFVH